LQDASGSARLVEKGGRAADLWEEEGLYGWDVGGRACGPPTHAMRLLKTLASVVRYEPDTIGSVSSRRIRQCLTRRKTRPRGRVMGGGRVVRMGSGRAGMCTPHPRHAAFEDVGKRCSVRAGHHWIRLFKTHPAVLDSSKKEAARQTYGRRKGCTDGMWEGGHVDPPPTPCGF
ncbi:MAG: hypothetical protein AN484_27820, partial [Aphanizomenon flos-aquae WA102]